MLHRAACVLALVLALPAAAQGVKEYTTPEIDIGVSSIGEGNPAARGATVRSDPDVFLGLEQQVLRRRVAVLEARLEMFERILVEFHGAPAEALIAQMEQSIGTVEQASDPVPSGDAPPDDGLSEIERALQAMDGE